MPRFNRDSMICSRILRGRPTPLQFAARLTEGSVDRAFISKRRSATYRGAQNHNAIGQGLLAVKMGKPRIIAETGAGQHESLRPRSPRIWASECGRLTWGTEDMARQALNVARMRMLGTQVVGVESGSRTFERCHQRSDARLGYQRTKHTLSSRLRSWRASPIHEVRDFQAVIGRERAIRSLQRKTAAYALFACVGGGSNSIGLFHQFLGRRRRENDRHWKQAAAAANSANTRLGSAAHQGFSGARPGVLQGTYTYVLQNEDGQIATTHSIPLASDYPAHPGPSTPGSPTSAAPNIPPSPIKPALDAAHLLSRTEGIYPALESAHAIAGLAERVPQNEQEDLVIPQSFGRGDKDMDTYFRLL